MLSLLALLPCLIVVITILWLKKSGVFAAAAATLTSSILWVAGPFLPPTVMQLENALIDTLILQLLVTGIILPGILFVEASAKAGTPNAISGVLKHLNLDATRTAIVIATGFGVMIESLTGYGVSLLVTVPLLATLVERRYVIGLALVGMSLMPWGALSMSAHLGSELAGITLDDLTLMIWGISGPIAFVLPCLCLLFVPSPSFRDFSFAICSGILLSCGIGLGSLLIGVEIAGVMGGVSVIGLATLVSNKRSGLWAVLATRAIAPYYILIASVLIQKFLISPLSEIGISPVISSSRVTFVLLASPGIALLVTAFLTIFILRKQEKSPSNGSPKLTILLLQRGWRPLFSIFLFMLSARLLVEIDAINALAGLISTTGPYPALIVVTLLGAVSGFVTGSGLAGNALFMPSAATTGLSFDATSLFATLQHSAAGHMAMAALPVAAILLAALPGRIHEDDQNVMRIGLKLNLVYVFLIVVTGSMFLYLGIR
jgi:lactate permease